MRRPDLSIGQRLGVGFGLLALVLIVFAGTVFVSQKTAEDSQAALLNRIIPRAESARELEGAMLRVAVAVRSYLLDRNSEKQQALSERIRQTRDTLAGAATRPRDPDGERLFQALHPAVIQYLEEAASVAALSAVASQAANETRLARAREAAAEHLRSYAALQRMKTQRALAELDAARKQLLGSMYAAFGIMMVVLTVLGMLIARSIRTPARELVRVAAELQSGNWHPALAFAPEAAAARGMSRSPRDELARILLAFGSAAEALEKREKRLHADAQVAASVASSLDRAEVARGALRAMAEAVGADAGALYWREDDDSLQPVAATAMPGPPQPLRIGEGLPGRAAEEGRVVVLADIPPETPMRLRLGVDEVLPQAIVAVPAMARGEVFGVAVLASIRPFDAQALEFLRAAGLQLGIGLSNVRSHEQAGRLLAELRESHEQVQAQNEELQAQNEEIQAQSEELQAQAEELQAQSEELQSQNEELQRGTADLARADEHKNHFLGLLAHELRNPLAAIAGSLHVLSRGREQTSTEAAGVAVIERQMSHLTRLIDDLLDVTRISHGKLELRRETVDLAALVRDGVNDLRVAAATAGIDLRMELPEGPVHVDGDRTRLAQVLGNLVSNAVKFTPRGGRVDVQLAANGAIAALRVRDNGVGIDADLRTRLFEPFSQGETGLARSNGGLGLGLSLSKALVELHRGRIEVQSAGDGAGSEFLVELPLATGVRAEAAAPTKSQAPAEPRRILLVEDNPDAAEMLRIALEMEGHQVQVAHTGLEAVEKASPAHHEIVLCDLGIPGIDGFEVARRLRANPRFEAIPLVALSGYASAEDRARSADAGFSYHLGKPVMIESLLELIARIETPARSGGARAPHKASTQPL